MKYKIGLEVHAQMNTSQKLYCDCPTDYQSVSPNMNTCPVCLGLPGNKPMPPNKDALDTAIELALMLGAKVVTNQKIYIQRKHYSYPDLPNGYQKTSTPIATDGKFLGVGIREVHLEDDPGRYDLSRGRVDYNRCGVPLVEIVTEPDMKTPEEARKFWVELTKLLESTGKMRVESGSIRSDVNVSLENSERVEVKNVNSSKGVYHSLQYEIKRQEKKLRRSMPIKRETRGFLEDKMITVALRTKETFADYRYIPDPDIPPIVITDEWAEGIKSQIKETPLSKQQRFIDVYKISPEMARTISYDRSLSRFYEGVARVYDPKLVAGLVSGELKKNLNQYSVSLDQSKVTERDFEGMLDCLNQGRISYKDAKEILDSSFKYSKPIGDVLSGYLKLASTESPFFGEYVSSVIKENPDLVDAYKKGRRRVLDFLVGQVIKKSGRSDPKKVYEELIKQLNGSDLPHPVQQS